MSVTPIPDDVARLICNRLHAGWTGRLTLNVKDGRILDVECAEKHRILARDRSEPRQQMSAGGSREQGQHD